MSTVIAGLFSFSVQQVFVVHF